VRAPHRRIANGAADFIIYRPEHEAFRETLRRFLERELTPNIEAWERDGIIARSFWRRAGQVGLIAPGMPEEYGGPGGDSSTNSSSPRSSAAAPPARAPAWLSNRVSRAFISSISGRKSSGGTTCQRSAPGRSFLTVAMTEPHCGSDLQAIKTTAVRDGDDYIINGSKTIFPEE